MENSMNKSELIIQLRGKNIDFPTKATVAELRKIFAENIGRNPANSYTITKPNNIPCKIVEPQTSDVSITDGFDNSQASYDAQSNASEIIFEMDDVENRSVCSENNGCLIVMDVNDGNSITNNQSAAIPVIAVNNKIDANEQVDLNGSLLGLPKSKRVMQLAEVRAEEELLTAKLRLMSKQKQLFEMETQMLGPITQKLLKPNYDDVKHLISSFSNADEYDAHKWLDDFERACDSVNADQSTRLTFFRQSMKSNSDAELFLRTDHSATYSDIRTHFLANFGHVFSISEVIDRLRKTTFRSTNSNSVMGYILKMQEIALRARIDEEQTVQFIIDGFQDTSPHIAVLYPATNIACLKKLAHRYSQLRELNQVQSKSDCRPIHTDDITSMSAASGVSNAFKLTTSSTAPCTNGCGFGHWLHKVFCAKTREQHFISLSNDDSSDTKTAFELH